jgi:hypothetical protein
MAYVAMTRGRYNHEAFLCQKFGNEADHEHAKPIASPAIHELRRGNKHSAEHHFKQILHKDDRSRTVYGGAQRTDRALLPERVADAIERHEARRGARMATWREYMKTAQALPAGYERMAAAAETRTASKGLDAGMKL